MKTIMTYSRAISYMKYLITIKKCCDNNNLSDSLFTQYSAIAYAKIDEIVNYKDDSIFVPWRAAARIKMIAFRSEDPPELHKK